MSYGCWWAATIRHLGWCTRRCPSPQSRGVLSHAWESFVCRLAYHSALAQVQVLTWQLNTWYRVLCIGHQVLVWSWHGIVSVCCCGCRLTWLLTYWSSAHVSIHVAPMGPLCASHATSACLRHVVMPHLDTSGPNLFLVGCMTQHGLVSECMCSASACWACVLCTAVLGWWQELGGISMLLWSPHPLLAWLDCIALLHK